MQFNVHSALVGLHAFLSPSTYHWLNYDEAKLEARYRTASAARRGTQLHELACDLIKLGVKLPDTQQTLNLYVNDAIGFRMVPEQVLYYSDNCFGTADAISFRNQILRISDLKTGVTPTSEKQLEVYAAIWCLEYRTPPHGIDIELRIYQDDSVRIYEADPDDIKVYMDKIVAFSAFIDNLKEGGL